MISLQTAVKVFHRDEKVDRDMKNIEHALCDYDKYYRNVLGIPTREREYSDSKIITNFFFRFGEAR